MRHQFVPGTRFEDVKAAYEFDRDLRDLLTEALEVVEIDFRAAVAFVMARAHGPLGYTSPGVFHTTFAHPDWLMKLRGETARSSEGFIRHFREAYGLSDVPVWAATEIMSFGSLSEMYKGMLRNDQKAVCSRYGLQPLDLAGWMHHFTYVRNLCAHHCRLWDRTWTIRPPLPSASAWHPPYLHGNSRLFVTLLALNTVLRRCPAVYEFAADWRKRVGALLNAPPKAAGALEQMDLHGRWGDHALWR